MYKILIVDDREENIYLLQSMLDVNGFVSVSAKNGVEALEQMRNDLPDLIISDVLMPVMDGFTLCRECKNDDRLMKVPFVFYSATYTDPLDEKYALGLGADRFILKPVDPDDFNKIIYDLLKKVNRKGYKPKEIKPKKDSVILKEYNEVLIRKLEDKMLQTALEEKELLESEAKYRYIFANNPQPMWIYDLETLAFLEVNQAAIHHYGYSKEEFLSMTLKDIRPVEDIDALMKYVEKTRKSYNPAGEWRHLKKNGELIYVEIISHTLTFNGRKARHVMVTDITKNMQVNNELRISEEKFRNVFENSIVGKSMTALDGGMNTNKAYSQILGYSPDELAGLKWYEITHPDDIENDQKTINSIISGELTSARWEKRYIHKNGNIVWVDISTVLQKDNEGKSLFFITSIIDITKRKHAEKESSKLSRIVEQSPVSIVLTDLKGNIEYVNPKFCDITGYTFEELIGKNPRLLKSGYTLAEEYKKLWQTITSGNDWSGQFLNLRKDGTSYWEQATISSIKDKDGKISSLMAIKEDITEKKKIELDLIAAKEKAEESDRLKTAFLHNISHEIRTPLNAIIGFSSFLDQPDLSEGDRKNFIDIIFQSNNQLLSIVNDILNISYIEADQVKVKKSIFDLKRILDNLYHQFLQEAQKKKINFELRSGLTISGALIETDESKFIQVITNLLNNAFKFTNEGQVTLGCRIDEGKVIISVEDTGIGIPEAEQAKIFDRFYQVDKSESRVYGGTGLGLAISAGFMKHLGGEIYVHSVVGKGSTFSMSIPYNKVVDLKKQEEVIVPDKAKISGSKLKILITEDEQSNFALLLAMLKSTGYILIHAKDGREAIEMCKKDLGINIVLMDIQMPYIDGFEATKEIMKFRPDLPVIAQTAFAHPSDKARALESGCVDYVSKPYSKLQIISLIEKYT